MELLKNTKKDLLSLGLENKKELINMTYSLTKITQFIC